MLPDLDLLLAIEALHVNLPVVSLFLYPDLSASAL